MTNVRIFQRPKNAMQSGRAGVQNWAIEFEPAGAQKADPLMGWAGSSDTQRQVRLSFATLDAAKTYAVKNGFDARIETPQKTVLKLQTYADNFR